MTHPRKQILVDRFQVLIPRVQRAVATATLQETDLSAALDAVPDWGAR